MTSNGIWTIDNKKESKLLRKKTEVFNFKRHSKKEIRDLINKMREMMKKSDGIGLSANQIGLDFNLFVARNEGKFYAIFNSKISKASKEYSAMEEGCLSVPEVFGPVVRPDRITLEGEDKNGKPLKIKAWGMLARIFQHETDHLNGMVFIDKATSVKFKQESI